MLLSPKNWSIGVQTFWMMLIVSLLLLWVGGATLSRMAHTIQLEQIEEEIDKRAALFSTTLLDALLSEDIPILETTLQGLVEIHPNLVGAEFCNYQNSPLLTWGENAPSCDEQNLKQPPMQGTLLTTQRPIIFEGERFGAVVLRWELRQQINVLEQQIQQFVYLMVAAVLFLALVLFVMVRQLVVRPIHRVDHYLRGVESGERWAGKRQEFVSKELIHLCEGVEVLEKSMEAEAQLHRELEELLASLEEKVVERTQELKQSNEQLTSIMEHMGDGLFVVDCDGRVEIYNPAATRLFPVLQTGSEHHNFQTLFSEELGEQVLQLLQEGDHQHETLFFSAQSGEQLSLEFSSSPLVIRAEEGHRLILVRDVTKQRELEEKEQMVAFQSGIAEMSISIMHNIGNILAGITGQVYKIKKGKTALKRTIGVLDKLADQIEEIPRETQREVLQRTQIMVDKLLEKEVDGALNRVEGGVQDISEIIRLQRSNVKPIFQLSRFPPRAFLHDVLAMLEPQRRQQAVEIEVTVEEGINEVYLPRNQLFQALVNLVKNSIEAIAEQQPDQGRISISLAHKTVDDIPGLGFSVQDNGVGIAPERIEALFSFGETSKKSGSGVGLHASGNFINSFGGKIGLESEGVGQGADAWIWLPLKQGEGGERKRGS